MVDFTHQGTGRGNRVPVSFSTIDGTGPYGFRGHCDEHGIHTELNVDRNDLVIEAQGMKWRPKKEYSASYCEACFNERRGTSVPSDADTADVARTVVDDCWRHIREAFEPAHLQTAGDLEYCPFCGDELVETGHADDRQREIVCETHGRIGLTIKHMEEPVHA